MSEFTDHLVGGAGRVCLLMFLSSVSYFALAQIELPATKDQKSIMIVLKNIEALMLIISSVIYTH
jgi:hypothetical protein